MSQQVEDFMDTLDWYIDCRAQAIKTDVQAYLKLKTEILPSIRQRLIEQLTAMIKED